MSLELPPSSPLPRRRMRGRGRFHCLDCGVAAPPPEMRIVFMPVQRRLAEELACDLRQQLNEPIPPLSPEMQAKLGPHDVVKSPPLLAKIEFTGYPPLHAQITRLGQTSLVVNWLHRMMVEEHTGRRTGIVQAVSLYLTGLDRDADNCAISYCRQMRLRPDNRPLPLTTAAYEVLLKERRPVAVQAFVQPIARLDPSIRTAFVGLGIAFFGSLGVGDEPDEKRG